MIVGTVKETSPGESRVALVPSILSPVTKAGWEVIMESGAGAEAGYPDADYEAKGVTLVSRREVFEKADVVLQVRGLGANPDEGKADLDSFRKGQILISLFEPLTAHDEVQAVASRGVSLFAMELIPRITRAQSMDVLSSMATVAGYRAVLLGAQYLRKMFPMLMTAAGTIAPARIFVVGAGVAGLQAIATARRLGAQVEAYDLRPAVKEQVQSLGAKFVEMELEAEKSEDKGGYAKAMSEDFYKKQRELMSRVVASSDVVITTAAVPGKKAPVLITADMVKKMAPRSVIVDVAAERGGNCELTRPGEVVEEHGVIIAGPTNLPAQASFHASQMYAKNVTTLLLHLTKDGRITLDLEDEIVRETLVTHEGEVTSARVKEAMELSSATT
jgi:NAD(P) transhydrogenase subunit alpha